MDNDIESSVILYDLLYFADLKPREIKVMFWRYCFNHTFDKIGKEYGYSKQYAHQLHNQALRKLRKQQRHIKELFTFDYL